MRYPLWKYLLVIVVLFLALIYALPSLYPDEPAVQISGANAGTEIDASVLTRAESLLSTAKIETHNNSFNDSTALIRISSESNDAQLRAQDVLRRELGNDYVVALSLAPTTPAWLRAIGAKPMKLGLDLRGGVHFLLEVDLDKSTERLLESSSNTVRELLNKEKMPFQSVTLDDQSSIVISFSDIQQRNDVASLLRKEHPEFKVQPLATATGPIIKLDYTESSQREYNTNAVEQNLITLRNRIQELGVSEAVVQTQGDNRIVVDLPGVQDTAEAKRVLGRTANLDFRLVSDKNNDFIDPMTAQPITDVLPPGTQLFERDEVGSGQWILLERQPILTGERVQNAGSGISQDAPGSEVNIRLDSAGGRLMAAATRNAQDRLMAVVFIEHKQKISFVTDPATGEKVELREPYTEETVINAATINDTLGSQFRITGLDSLKGANELALMLRAGSLAAPMYFVEERVVGPSLGQDNIDKGMLSTQIGFILVAIWMVVFYRVFGLIADFALVCNLALILAIMSFAGFTLTLPGIAGIVITIGMAVDANVLICERIREEIHWGASPKQAIVAGYQRAFTTILDSNITTLLVAFILFAVGTGPIKGFAVTLIIGLLCSMFTAITVTRAIVQLVYGKRANVKKLSI